MGWEITFCALWEQFDSAEYILQASLKKTWVDMEIWGFHTNTHTHLLYFPQP